MASARQYLEYARDQARTRYEAGMDVCEAAKDIELHEYSALLLPLQAEPTADRHEAT